MSHATPDTSLSPVARQKSWWRAPKRVTAHAFNHEGFETFPNCPPIPCLKLRGLWMHLLGIRPGTRLYVQTQPGRIVLSMDDPREADAITVRYRKGSRSQIILDAQ